MEFNENSVEGRAETARKNSVSHFHVTSYFAIKNGRIKEELNCTV